MNQNKIVYPSSQVQSTLPKVISENYTRFVNFMTTAGEANERVGFGQDILQNLQKYRDFDTYNQTIIKENVLDKNVSLTDEELTLVDGFGFPEKNGIVLINEEVILYRVKTGNVLTGLQRGASGTTQLENYKTEGEFVRTEAAEHDKGDIVKNLSVLFLSSMLETIHNSFSPGISSDSVHPDINRSSLLQNIKDFFQSKGTSLGIKALFKMLFATNDVEVRYPGDRMIKPSTSTFTEKMVMRVVPIPEVLCGLEILERYQTPDELIGQELVFKSFNDDKVFARAKCDYVSSTQQENELQYEIWINPNSYTGNIAANPKSVLTRELVESGSGLIDYETVTVETTLGFPDSGVIFVENEGISYTSKTFNQFLGCKRGHIGVETTHTKGSVVYGPYFIESVTVKDGFTYKSLSHPLGLVESVDIRDGGLLHLMDDTVVVNGPGKDDPREVILSSFLENYDDDLATRASVNVGDITTITHGVSGIYFDNEEVFVTSSNLPSTPVGDFGSDLNVGQDLEPVNAVHIIPRREQIKPNESILDKGTDAIGVFIDGVPAYSNHAPVTITQGDVASFIIHNHGENYKNPTVVFDPPLIVAQPIIDKGRVVDITKFDRGYFTDTPSVRISSGEGASFSTKFDRYGRLTEINIVDGGEYYNDVPTILLLDSSGRGKGALISCEVNNGQIVSVEILNSGLDYNPVTTSVSVRPVGEGAVVEAVIETYTFERVAEVNNNPDHDFDDNNGYLYLDENVVQSRYAFTHNPKKLRETLGDDGTEHSPLLGWAYDGNPIYGPFGYSNKVDGTVERLVSGYKLLPSRSVVFPSGYPEGEALAGTMPPDETTYPMGTFVEDYVHSDNSFLEGYLNSERYQDMWTELTQEIEVSYRDPLSGLLGNVMLDKFNGRVCNTPEFPKELYPDGVYCYFITTDDSEESVFPYIIGKTFKNRPISQRMDLVSSEKLNPIEYSTQYKPTSYENPTLTFDFTAVERYRNSYLTSTKEGVELEIANLTTGSVSGVDIISTSTDRSRVGDLVYFEDKDTGGDGASAVVSYVAGETVTKSETEGIYTYTNSKRFVLDLSYMVSNSYVFTVGSYVDFTSGALGVVESYVQDRLNANGEKTLTIRVINNIDLTNTDCFEDNKGREICFPGSIPYITSTKNVGGYILELGQSEDDFRAESIRYNIELEDNTTITHRIRNPFRNGVIPTVEVANSTVLSFDNLTHFYPGDKVFLSGRTPIDETDTILEKFGLYDASIDRVDANVPDGTVMENKSKSLYVIETSTPHRMRDGDKVLIENSQFDEVNAEHSIMVMSANRFSFYVSKNYGTDTGLVYSTSSSRGESNATHIKMISGGLGYKSLPEVIGLYRREDIRAKTMVQVTGTSISTVDILVGGYGYVNPIAHFVDLSGSGSGAKGIVTLDNGVVTGVTVTDGGTGYEEPYLILIEPCEMTALTTNIGRVTSMNVVSPGRKISADRSLKPEVQLPIRLVLSNVVGTYGPGDDVYQGTATMKQVTGTVESYDDKRQTLVVTDYTGVFKKGKVFIGSGEAEILITGQADMAVYVNGTSSLDDVFIDDTSKVSEAYPVIQDSYYFQWFSYVIASSMQKHQYESYVKEIIHPSGFIQFSEVEMESQVRTPVRVE